jgi:hypothetical protein
MHDHFPALNNGTGLPTGVPRLEDIATTPHGLDPIGVAAAFEAFERQLVRASHGSTLPAVAEPAGEALRTDSMRLLRAAVEFADVIERDAQEVAERRMARLESEVREREGSLRRREAQVAEREAELERQKGSMMITARREAEEIVAVAQRDAQQTRRVAEEALEEARGDAVQIRREAERTGVNAAEMSRQQAVEAAHAARAEVERTLEWARAQADSVVRRARSVAEQLMSGAASGVDVARLVEAIAADAEADQNAQYQEHKPQALTAGSAPVTPSDMVLPYASDVHDGDWRPRHVPPSLAER